MADNKDVVISASMSDKDLLSSIDETLKKTEKRLEDFTNKLEGKLASVEGFADQLGKNIGKGLVDGFNQQIRPLETKISELEAKLKSLGATNIAQGNTAATQAATTNVSVDVNSMNQALQVANNLREVFSKIQGNTTRIKNNMEQLATVKTDVQEARINVHVAQREKLLQREILLRQQTANLAARIAREEEKSRISQGGQSYEKAMAMGNKSIQERIEKLKALQIVQRNLSTDDANYAAKLATVNKEMASLKKANADAISSGVQLQKVNSGLMESFKNLGKRVLFYAGLGAITGFVKSLMDVRGQYELLERSIGAVLNDFEKGSQIFREQQTLALKSPFTVIDLASTTKMLAAYNFEAEELVDVSKRIADISAALGVPMERLTYNLGQIRAQTVLTARDARDFANAGLSITSELAKMYTEQEQRIVSVGDVMDRMSNKMVSFTDVMKVLNRYTDEGGMFYDFQAKQAETLAGKLSNLTDAYDFMLNEIGKEHQGILTGSISVVQKLFENWRAVSSALTVVISTIGAYKAMQALANIETLNGTRLTIKQTLAEVARARATQGTAAATLAAARAQGVLNRALAFVAANPYAAVAAGAVALLTTFAILLPKAKSVEEQIEGLDEASTHLKKSFENLSNVEDLISQYDNLQKTIRTTQETIDAYADSSEKSAKNNKDLETAVNSNKEAHNQLDKVMSKLVDATTPAIISKMNEYGKILGINTKAAREFAEALSQSNIKGTEQQLSELEKRRDQLITDIAKQSQLYNKGLVEVVAGMAGEIYTRPASAKEEKAAFENLQKMQKELASINASIQKANDSLSGLKEPTDDETKALSKWQAIVDDITSKNERIGNIFKFKEDEGIFDYTDRLKKEYKELKKQEDLINEGLLVDDESKEWTQQRIKMVREIANSLRINLTSQKDLNKSKKEEMDLLKQQIKLVDDIQKKFLQLVKDTGNITYATEKVKEAYQDLFDNAFKGVSVDINDLITFDKGSAPKFYNKIAETLKSPEAKQLVAGKKAQSEIEYSISINSASVALAKRKIEGMFQGYELELDIEGAGQFGSLFAGLFEYDPVSLEQLEADVNATLNSLREKVSSVQKEQQKLQDLINQNPNDTRVDSWKSSLNTLVQNESDASKAIEDIQKRLSDTIKQAALDDFKNFQSIADKYAEMEDKIAEVERKRLEDQASISNRVTDATSDLAKLELQLSVTESPDVRAEIESEIEEIQNFINEKAPKLSLAVDTGAEQEKTKIAFEEWKNTSNAWEKSFQDLNAISTVSLNNMIDEIERFAVANRANMPINEYKELMARIKALKTEVNSRNPFALLADQVENLKDNFKGLDGSFESTVEYVSQLGMSVSSIGNIFEQMGFSEGVSDTISTIGEAIQGASQAAQGIAQIAGGDILGGTINTLGGIWQGVSAIFNAGNKKITREVEKSERRVKQLENAYKNLERAVDKSMGKAEIAAQKAAIANQKAQLAEVQRQLQLEKSRKKKNRDQDKIIELEGQVTDLQNAIDDATTNIVNTLLGTDVKSAAESFADSWISAWKEGADTMENLEESFDDLITNMIVKSLASTIVGERLKSMFAMVKRFTEENSAGGVGITAEEAKQIADLGKELIPLINEDLKNLMGQLGIEFGSGVKDAALSSLQKGISSVTEETAGAIEAYLNMVSGQVFQQTTILQGIWDMTNVNAGTMSQMLLQMRSSYQILQAIQVWTVNISTAAGNGVNVRILPD
jgi:chromosome segregation ATPase|uniref:Tape measure domain protein n=1 Tax=Myoviridae sp. ctPoO4 TaxID=2827685 RepID=A0A8S5SM48_9CAUD|nr:MAG TPA: Tape measure domain protein [Myoviridae sp. ctPoO4]